jgi:hypothetical protein
LAGCFIDTDATLELAPVGVLEPVRRRAARERDRHAVRQDGLYETSPRSAMLFGGFTVIPASCDWTVVMSR